MQPLSLPPSQSLWALLPKEGGRERKESAMEGSQCWKMRMLKVAKKIRVRAGPNSSLILRSLREKVWAET